MDLVETVAYILSLLTLLAHIGIAIFFVLYFFFRKIFNKTLAKHKNYFIKYAMVVALVATFGSLFFSDVAGYEPCKLCWYQRIFMYPQVFLFGLALYKKERVVVDYALTLSILGAGIALYHYLMQVNLVPSGVCSVIGYSASCSQRFEMEYGYITIPMMSLTAFFIISSLMVLSRKTFKSK